MDKLAEMELQQELDYQRDKLADERKKRLEALTKLEGWNDLQELIDAEITQCRSDCVDLANRDLRDRAHDEYMVWTALKYTMESWLNYKRKYEDAEQQ